MAKVVAREASLHILLELTPGLCAGASIGRAVFTGSDMRDRSVMDRKVV